MMGDSYRGDCVVLNNVKYFTCDNDPDVSRLQGGDTLQHPTTDATKRIPPRLLLPTSRDSSQ